MVESYRRNMGQSEAFWRPGEFLPTAFHLRRRAAASFAEGGRVFRISFFRSDEAGSRRGVSRLEARDVAKGELCRALSCAPGIGAAYTQRHINKHKHDIGDFLRFTQTAYSPLSRFTAWVGAQNEDSQSRRCCERHPFYLSQLTIAFSICLFRAISCVSLDRPALRCCGFWQAPRD